MNAKTVEEVTRLAALVDQYGALVVIGVVLGLFFIVTATLIFKRFFSALEHGEALRDQRDKSLDEERRRLLDQLLALTNGSTETMRSVGEAVREVTKELVEFRRDTHRAFSEVEGAFKELSEVTESRRAEATQQFEGLRLQNQEIAQRLDKIERDAARRREDYQPQTP